MGRPIYTTEIYATHERGFILQYQESILRNVIALICLSHLFERHLRQKGEISWEKETFYDISDDNKKVPEKQHI